MINVCCISHPYKIRVVESFKVGNIKLEKYQEVFTAIFDVTVNKNETCSSLSVIGIYFINDKLNLELLLINETDSNFLKQRCLYIEKVQNYNKHISNLPNCIFVGQNEYSIKWNKK